jgi:hypothetical protein
MSIRYIFLVLLATVTVSLKAQIPTPQQDQTQKDPLALGLDMVFKLYAPHKVELRKIRQNLDGILEKLIAIDIQVKTTSLSSGMKQKLTKVVEKKIKKIVRTITTIASIKRALDNCPNNAKTENAQKALAKVGTKFLAQDNPDILSVKADEMLILATDLLKALES